MGKTSRLSEVMLSSCWVPPRALNGLQTHPECLRRRAHTRTHTQGGDAALSHGNLTLCARFRWDHVTWKSRSRSHRLMASGPRLKC